MQSISVCLGPYVNLVIPPILSILDDPSVKMEVRQLALNTIYHLSCTLCLIPNAPRIVQVWLRVISVPALQPRLLDLLVVSVKQVRRFVFWNFLDAFDCYLFNLSSTVALPFVQMSKIVFFVHNLQLKMWRQFMVFRESVDAVLSKHGLYCEEYSK